MQKEIRVYQTPPTQTRWEAGDVLSLYCKPFMDLLYQAASIHRQHFNPSAVQKSTLLSIKTGGCPEDCHYCPQSIHHETSVANKPMLTVEEVRETARRAKQSGASRFCMGAAWRGPKLKDIDTVCSMIAAVKEEGLEACATLGLLRDGMAERLREAGLDYYNHNLDTSPDYYQDVIHTRSFHDRLDTLARIREAGISMCCGGIVGMGETREDRVALLTLLANMDPPPESVPINQLVKVDGTPMQDVQALDWSERSYYCRSKGFDAQGTRTPFCWSSSYV